jgi:hypothetical protein
MNGVPVSAVGVLPRQAGTVLDIVQTANPRVSSEMIENRNIGSEHSQPLVWNSESTYLLLTILQGISKPMRIPDFLVHTIFDSASFGSIALFPSLSRLFVLCLMRDCPCTITCPVTVRWLISLRPSDELSRRVEEVMKFAEI